MNRCLYALLTVAMLLVAAGVRADSTTPLREEILDLDRAFFDAFNTCDIDTMSSLFAEDLEFFHDKAGLAGHDETIQSITELCERDLGLARTLELDTLSVYPIKDYGAIQEAEHTFCHMEDGKEDCGTFKFVHVWRKADGRWQLARVISYGH